MYDFVMDTTWASGDPVKLSMLGMWLIVFFITAFLTTLVATESCSPGFYAVSTKDGQECVPCSVCEAGQGVVTPCGSFNDTECSNCSEGYFSRLTASGQECTQCESCSPERIETSPCTSTQNSVCGRCSGGYFLYVDNDGSACRPCSLCPAGIVAVRWIECAEAGEPLHNQCAPGEWTGVTSSTIAVHTPTTVNIPKPTRLPTNHGMFVPMASYQYTNIAPPPSSTAPKAIGIASIVFTAATFVVFIIAIFCLIIGSSSKKYCCYSSCKKPSCQRCLRRGSKKGYPVQAQDDGHVSAIQPPLRTKPHSSIYRHT